MTTKKIMQEIARHVAKTTEELDDSEVENMIKLIRKANRIFVIGAGRSGLTARAFAMRLVQLGLTAYVVGETITPGMNKKDLLIAVSGSGETSSVVSATKIAKSIGVKVLAITSYPKSSIGKISDYVMKIKGKTKIDIEKNHLKHQIEGIHSSLTPLGTMFEDTTQIFFDGVTAELMEKLGKKEKDMKKIHALE